MSAATTRVLRFFMGVAVSSLPSLAHAQARAIADSNSVADLPAFEVPAKNPGPTIAIFITGDGGWATLDRRVVDVLTDHGIPVVVLNSRNYLAHRKSPDDLARDLTRLSRHYMTAWHRDNLIIAGYSRGADLIPFGVARMPADVRQHVSLVALIGLARRAGFEFHLIDIVASPHRASDLPTVPEVLKLKGMKILCVYGADEKESGCPDPPPGMMQVIAVPGGHHFDDDFRHLGELIVAAMR